MSSTVRTTCMIAMETMAARIHIKMMRPTTLAALSFIIYDPSSLKKILITPIIKRLHRLQNHWRIKKNLGNPFFNLCNQRATSIFPELSSSFIHRNWLSTWNRHFLFHLLLFLESHGSGCSNEAEEEDGCRDQLKENNDCSHDQEDPEGGPSSLQIDGSCKCRSRK